MADWEEVKRLAADLQRAQLSNTIQRLSERNCIEIVSKLIEQRLLEVIFTTDGKEYITPQHLRNEIKDELFASGGRINVVDLVQVLNVDFSHVDLKVNELVRVDPNLHLVLGQLIDRDYLNRLGEEINEKLQQNGQVTIGELTKLYDLPPDFIQGVVDERLGTVIFGKADPSDSRIIFTDSFITRQRAKVLGALTAVTRPTTVMNVMNRHNLQERLFYTLLEELTDSGRLAGSISGGRQERAVYIPDIYSIAQNEWVDNFYKQNGYLEYDALIRMGINEPKTFIRKHFKNEPLTFLNTCSVGKGLFDQIEVAVDEALLNGSWVDLMPILPSVLSSTDGNQLLQMVLKARSKGSNQALVFCDTIACSEKFVQDIVKAFNSIMNVNAEKDAQKGLSGLNQGSSASGESAAGKKDKKDDRRKKAHGGKSGGGTQGRETRTKSVKKKYRASKDSDDSEDEEPASRGKKAGEIPFLSIDEIMEELQKREELEECPTEFLLEIAEHIHRPLTKAYQEVVQSVFLASAAATGASRRKTHGELQEKVNGLLVNIRLFEKGLKLLPDDVQTQLVKHLLKTIATDVVNMMVVYLAQEQMIQVEDSALTPESRNKLIQKLPEEIKVPLVKLNSTVNGKSIEEFLEAIEDATGPSSCDIIIKKLDKKKERQVVFGHRQALLEQLAATMDTALALHLTVLVLFQIYTHCMLHASGKFVPQVLMFLETHLSPESLSFLQSYQGLVIKQLTLTDDPEQLHEVSGKLEELLPRVKEVALSAKRHSQSEQD